MKISKTNRISAPVRPRERSPFRRSPAFCSPSVFQPGNPVGILYDSENHGAFYLKHPQCSLMNIAGLVAGGFDDNAAGTIRGIARNTRPVSRKPQPACPPPSRQGCEGAAWDLARSGLVRGAFDLFQMFVRISRVSQGSTITNRSF